MGAGPPGSAGVSPACTAVACRSVSLRWRTRPAEPCRPQGPDATRHGLRPRSRRVPLEKRVMGAGPPGSAWAVSPACTAEGGSVRRAQFPCPVTGGHHASRPRRETATVLTIKRPKAGPDAMAGDAPCGRGCAPVPSRDSLRSPLRSKSNGSRSTRERGRPARMHCRSVPLSFPAMGHAARHPLATHGKPEGQSRRRTQRRGSALVLGCGPQRQGVLTGAWAGLRPGATTSAPSHGLTTARVWVKPAHSPGIEAIVRRTKGRDSRGSAPRGSPSKAGEPKSRLTALLQHHGGRVEESLGHGMTWSAVGLEDRVQRGGYRATPSRRVKIPADGGTRKTTC